MIYPQVRRSDHTDDYHGTVVADPYRWLEDPDSEETQQFVAAENECTAKVFEKVPYRKEIQERMTKLYNYEKYSCPKKRAGKYFFYKNNGLQNQYVLYMQDSLDSPAQVLLDPNTLSDDGTAALSSTALSEGKVGNALYFAHGISRGGSDWQTVKVLNVKTKEYLPDSVQWVKFTSLAWMHDDSGFFYSRFPAPKGLESSNPESSESKIGTETDLNRDQQIWFHRIGTNQSEDQLIYAFPSHPTYYLNAEVTDDGQHLVIYLRDGCKNASMVHIADLSSFHSWLETRSSPETIIQVKKLVDNMDAAYEYLLNDGSEFYFQTNLDAPRERVVKCDVSQETTEWVEVIAEPNESAVLESAIPVGDNYLLVNSLEDVKNVLKLYTIAGEYKATIPQPSVGTVLVSARRFEDEYFFKFVSFLYPGTIFQHSVASIDAHPVVYRETKIDGFDPSNYETKQVFYPSKDGTKIPMFLVGKKNIPLMGMNPVYLYGYGGFNIAIKPSFSIFRLVFVQHFNGLLAFPNLRGGSEYGENWHQQGTFGKKQNVFDDFQAAAEYLIQEEYTAPSKIAIHGTYETTNDADSLIYVCRWKQWRFTCCSMCEPAT